MRTVYTCVLLLMLQGFCFAKTPESISIFCVNLQIDSDKSGNQVNINTSKSSKASVSVYNNFLELQGSINAVSDLFCTKEIWKISFEKAKLYNRELLQPYYNSRDEFEKRDTKDEVQKLVLYSNANCNNSYGLGVDNNSKTLYLNISNIVQKYEELKATIVRLPDTKHLKEYLMEYGRFNMFISWLNRKAYTTKDKNLFNTIIAFLAENRTVDEIFKNQSILNLFKQEFIPLYYALSEFKHYFHKLLIWAKHQNKDHEKPNLEGVTDINMDNKINLVSSVDIESEEYKKSIEGKKQRVKELLAEIKKWNDEHASKKLKDYVTIGEAPYFYPLKDGKPFLGNETYDGFGMTAALDLSMLLYDLNTPHKSKTEKYGKYLIKRRNDGSTYRLLEKDQYTSEHYKSEIDYWNKTHKHQITLDSNYNILIDGHDWNDDAVVKDDSIYNETIITAGTLARKEWDEHTPKSTFKFVKESYSIDKFDGQYIRAPFRSPGDDRRPNIDRYTYDTLKSRALWALDLVNIWNKNHPDIQVNITAVNHSNENTGRVYVGHKFQIKGVDVDLGGTDLESTIYWGLGLQDNKTKSLVTTLVHYLQEIPAFDEATNRSKQYEKLSNTD